MTSKWKIGERVKLKNGCRPGVDYSNQLPDGTVGRVVGYEPFGGLPLVKFPGWAGGHNGNPRKTGNGWFVSDCYLEAAGPHDFMVGDKIDLIDPPPYWGAVSPKAGPFTIVGVGGGAVVVRDAAGIRSGPWFLGRFKLAETGAPRPVESALSPVAPRPGVGKFIVISDEGPSSKPYEHTTRGAAEKEAARLAIKIPGLGFTVYQAVTRVEAEKPQAVAQFLDNLAA